MNISPDYFIHAANVLLLVAYSVRDILWLRLFAVAAAIITIPYYFLQPTVLWAPLAWSVAFAGINSLQSWRLILERRPIKLTDDEAEVRRLAFPDVPPRKVLQLLGIGAWTTEPSGVQLVENGKTPEDVALVVRGKVRVSRPGSDLGVLGPGNLVGSALILSGVPADFNAVVEEPVRAVRWRIDALDKYLQAHPDMRVVTQRHLARELSKKVGHLAQGAASQG